MTSLNFGDQADKASKVVQGLYQTWPHLSTEERVEILLFAAQITLTHEASTLGLMDLYHSDSLRAVRDYTHLRYGDTEGTA